MPTTLLKNATAVVTLDDKDSVLYNADILIQDNVIAETGTCPCPNVDKVIDVSGCYVYPGLINTHHHLYQTFTRNLPQIQKLELFPWLSFLYEIWKNLEDEDVYYSSLTGMGELLRYGCTTVMDHHYIFPRGKDCRFIENQFDAAARLGLRFCASRGSMSRGRKDGGLPPDSVVQDIDTILSDGERLIKKFHDPQSYSMHRMALAPCSPFSVTEQLLRETAVLARKHGVRLHTHLCETMDEERYCLEKVGKRPLAYMESCDWYGNEVWYAHGIFFNNDELQLLAKTKTGVAHCPTSNMKLASGVCKIPEMLELGVPLGLAVDGSASNDCSNLMAEIRNAYLLQRLSQKQKAPSGYDFLKMATRGGAALLGMNEIGCIAKGKAADLFVVKADILDLAGAYCDPKNIFATVGYNRPAKWVMVNGKVVVENGVLLGIDEESVAHKANELAAALLSRSNIDNNTPLCYNNKKK
jgi:cytosine/adenosine deaminase-related metal-dependent hydrolase